jgi:hypothetical protein
MNRLHTLIRTPEPHSLSEASERAPLSLLAAAALCSRNALTVLHRRAFDCPIHEADDEPSPPAISLVALELTKRIDALLRGLRLYDAALRDHLLAERHQDLPF